MDGLVTNVSLIAGVGGGGVAGHTVVLTGFAGLVAGAFSMAIGEFTSVRSQNELVDAEVAAERTALETHPREEGRELAASLVRRGVSPDLARQVSEQISETPEQALQFHAQEELGVRPDALPSPYEAAGLSFISFALGALVPLLPYVVGATVLWLSCAVSAVALAVSGAVVAHLTTRPITRGVVRQLGLAALSVAVTYGIGRAIGAGVA
jgi:VIT1/CCC1 family predicted Fe2+/Mn2+ transporter